MPYPFRDDFELFDRGLPLRAYMLCRRRGLTVFYIARMTDDELLAEPGLGPTMLAQIRRAVPERIDPQS